jgi:hypothetical protein
VAVPIGSAYRVVHGRRPWPRPEPLNLLVQFRLDRVGFAAERGTSSSVMSRNRTRSSVVKVNSAVPSRRSR